jgi:hypothetical protein
MLRYGMLLLPQLDNWKIIPVFNAVKLKRINNRACRATPLSLPDTLVYRL